MAVEYVGDDTSNIEHNLVKWISANDRQMSEISPRKEFDFSNQSGKKLNYWEGKW